MKISEIRNLFPEVSEKIERAVTKLTYSMDIKDIIELKISQIEFLSCCKVLKMLSDLEKEALSLLE